MAVLITGATGNIGREVVRRLLARGLLVRALTRDPGRADLPEGAAAVPGSPSDPASLREALDGVEKVLLVLTADIVAQAHGFAAAVEAGARGLRHIVLLSSLSVQHPVRHSIGEDHRSVEELVHGTGVACTILRPGPLHSNALWWAPSIRERRTVRSVVGNQPAAPVDPCDVAEVATAALGGDGHEHRTYGLTGGERITPEQQARVIGRLIERDIRFEVPSEEEAAAEFGAAPELALANIRALRSPDAPWARPLPTVREITGHAPRTFHRWALDHRSAFD